MAQVDFNNLVTTTLKLYMPRVADVIFKGNPFAYKMEQMGRIRKDGGTSIVEPLIYAENESFKSYSGYEVLDLKDTDILTAAEYEWKQNSISIAVSGEERLKNAGSRTKVRNLLKTKMKVAEKTLHQEFERMYTGDGGTKAKNPKEFHGIKLLVGTTDNLVGGIQAGGANDWWNPKVTTQPAVSGKRDVSVANMMRKRVELSKGGFEKTDLILTTPELWLQYHAILDDKVRYQDKLLASAGFDNLLLNSTPVVFTDSASFQKDGLNDNHMYYLNMDYLAVVAHSNRWLTHGPWIRPENQDAEYCQIMSMGNVTCNNRMYQGCIIFAES